ncbi:hypothetical protein TNCT1_33390 [Streptomyces sp. 1-11]|nr:hypothetical protein TNCT1_33390 [Streptomyces sp. 1-11]
MGRTKVAGASVTADAGPFGGEGRIRTCVDPERPDREACSLVPDQPLRAPLPVPGLRVFPAPFT